MMIQTTFDKCEHCHKTNVPHNIHYRFCNKCEKTTYHNFQNWKANQNPNQTSCIICGEL